jgi:SAM-dependent methyltransferase
VVLQQLLVVTKGCRIGRVSAVNEEVQLLSPLSSGRYDLTVEIRLAPLHAKDLVRRGYDRISHAYRDDHGDAEVDYRVWLETHLFPRLSTQASVLDLGCGNGVPATRMLAERFAVIGVDISDVQISRARRLVPAGTFVRADITGLDFPPESFNAVVCLFALIHIPVEEQPGVLQRISAWLPPGGLLLATVGHHAWTGVADFYGADMYWSQADASTYCTWLSEVGIDVVQREFVAEEPSDGHELILGVRRGGVTEVAAQQS